MNGVTEKQLKVLHIVHDYASIHGWMPSLREIRTLYGCSHVKNIADHLDRLQDKGLLVRHSGARQIVITQEGRNLLRRTEKCKVSTG